MSNTCEKLWSYYQKYMINIGVEDLTTQHRLFKEMTDVIVQQTDPTQLEEVLFNRMMYYRDMCDYYDRFAYKPVKPTRPGGRVWI